MSRRFHLAGLALAALALAGCAAPPPDRFYSLNGGAETAVPAGLAKTAGPTSGLYIEMLAVSIPDQVSRNQLVVTSSGGRIELLEQDRWVGPLAGEIGQVLSTSVSNQLGAIDVFRTPYPDKSPVYRISTNVQRFESAPGKYALIDAVWSVRLVGGTKVLTCRSVANEEVGPGNDAVVAGHRRAVVRIGADIAKAVRALAAGGDAGC